MSELSYSTTLIQLLSWYSKLTNPANRSFRRGWEDMTDIPRYNHSYQWNPGASIPSTPRTSIEFLDACSGWLATYEVFAIRESRSDSSSIATIPLDAEDIAVCLRQNLRFNPACGWKCSFPFTIAPTLDKISILHNVIHFSLDGTTFTVAPISADSHPRFGVVRFSKTRFVLPYSYRLFWSLDSRYLAVTDSGFWEPGGKEHIFLAIFSTAAVGKTTRLINHTMVPSNRGEWLHDCAFHPTEPLFLYWRDCSVFLWDFRQRTSRL